MVNKFKVFNMSLSENGPLSIPITVDLTSITSNVIDLTEDVNNGNIDFISGVWVDNSDNTSTLTITCNGTNQSIKCPANSQGYFTVMVTNPPVFTVSTSGAVKVSLIFINTPQFPIIWSTP